METITSCNVETLGSAVILSLALGDILDELAEGDIVVASVWAGSYETDAFPNSLIAGLERRFGIRFSLELASPKFDLRRGLSSWATHTKCGVTILLLEFEPGRPFAEVFADLGFALQVLLRKHDVTTPVRVLMPILGTGAQGHELAEVAPALLSAASRSFSQLLGVSEIFIVDRHPERLTEVKHYWDQYLGRGHATQLSSQLAESVKQEIESLYHQHHLLELRQHRWTEDLWKLLRDDRVSSDTLPAICRQIVESVVSDLWSKMKPNRKSRGLADDIEDLKNMGLAQWIIGYLHTLRQFGNYGSHYQGAAKTIPESLSENDLILCLQCIRSILPVWRNWGESIQQSSH